MAGGAGGNLSLNGALLIEKSGAVGRLGGVFAALVCAVVLFAGADVGAMVPKAILMGMLAYLGATILAETLRSPAQSSLAEWGLAGAIMLVIVNFGYLMGVVLGVIGACLMFALSYSRIGVIRRHLTRARLLQQCRARAGANPVAAGRGRARCMCSGFRALSSSARPTGCSSASGG